MPNSLHDPGDLLVVHLLVTRDDDVAFYIDMRDKISLPLECEMFWLANIQLDGEKVKLWLGNTPII